MKHAQIVIINLAVSQAIHGTPPPKPVRRNAQVLISILVQEQVIPAAAVRLAAENIQLVNVQADMTGAAALVRNVQVLINILVIVAII